MHIGRDDDDADDDDDDEDDDDDADDDDDDPTRAPHSSLCIIDDVYLCWITVMNELI